MTTTRQSEEIPVVDAQIYMNKDQGWEDECKKTAYSFHKFGIVKFRDPRVVESDNDFYLNMVEKYFKEISEKYYAGEELKDVRAEIRTKDQELQFMEMILEDKQRQKQQRK